MKPAALAGATIGQSTAKIAPKIRKPVVIKVTSPDGQVYRMTWQGKGDPTDADIEEAYQTMRTTHEKAQEAFGGVKAGSDVHRQNRSVMRPPTDTERELAKTDWNPKIKQDQLGNMSLMDLYTTFRDAKQTVSGENQSADVVNEATGRLGNTINQAMQYSPARALPFGGKTTEILSGMLAGGATSMPNAIANLRASDPKVQSAGLLELLTNVIGAGEWGGGLKAAERVVQKSPRGIPAKLEPKELAGYDPGVTPDNRAGLKPLPPKSIDPAPSVTNVTPEPTVAPAPKVRKVEIWPTKKDGTQATSTTAKKEGNVLNDATRANLHSTPNAVLPDDWAKAKAELERAKPGSKSYQAKKEKFDVLDERMQRANRTGTTDLEGALQESIAARTPEVSQPPAVSQTGNQAIQETELSARADASIPAPELHGPLDAESQSIYDEGLALQRRIEGLSAAMDRQKSEAQALIASGDLRLQDGDKWIAHTKKGQKYLDTDKGDGPSLVKNGDIELLRDGAMYPVTDTGKAFVESAIKERESFGFGRHNPSLIAQLEMLKHTTKMQDNPSRNAGVAKPGTQAGSEAGRSGHISPNLSETARADATPSIPAPEATATSTLRERIATRAAEARARTTALGEGGPTPLASGLDPEALMDFIYIAMDDIITLGGDAVAAMKKFAADHKGKLSDTDVEHIMRSAKRYVDSGTEPPQPGKAGIDDIPKSSGGADVMQPDMFAPETFDPKLPKVDPYPKVDAKDKTFFGAVRGVTRSIRLMSVFNRLSDTAQNTISTGLEMGAKGIEPALDRVLFPAARKAEGAANEWVSPKELFSAVMDTKKSIVNRAAEQLKIGNVEELAKYGIHQEAPGVFKYVGRATGLSDVAFRDFWHNITVKELSKNKRLSPEHIKALADDEELLQVFANDNFVGNMQRSLEKSTEGSEMGQAGMLALDLAIPFPKILANVAGRASDYAAGSIKAGIRYLMDKKAGKMLTITQRRYINSLLSRQMIGAGAMYAGYALAENGLITINVNKDGYLEYPKWMERVGGAFAKAIQLGAASQAIAKSVTDKDKQNDLMFKAFTDVFDQPTISGGARASNLLAGGEKLDKLGKETGRMLSSAIIPAEIRNWGTWFDDTRYQTKGFTDELKKATPWTRKQLPVKGAKPETTGGGPSPRGIPVQGNAAIGTPSPGRPTGR